MFRVQSRLRVDLEFVQSRFRVDSDFVQSMFRVCSEYIQSMFRVCFISSSSVSSVSVFGIFNMKTTLSTHLCIIFNGALLI